MNVDTPIIDENLVGGDVSEMNYASSGVMQLAELSLSYCDS